MSVHTPITPHEPVPEHYWTTTPQLVPVWHPTEGYWFRVARRYLPEFKKMVPDWPEECFSEVEKALAMNGEG